MNTIEVHSIYEYLELVSTLTVGESAADSRVELWYRGSSSLEFGLVPSLYWREQAEWEGNFISKFLVRYKAYVTESIDSPWEQFALMQHHGLPTRLLDWSRSPLSALYFALTQDPNSNTDRVVWILPPYELNEHNLGLASIFCPGILQSRHLKVDKEKAINLDAYLPQALDPLDHYSLPEKAIAIESPLSGARIKAQQGCFTLHGSLQDGIEKQFTKASAPYLAAVVLKTKGNIDSFLKPLLSWGINEESIYQDLDSMTRNILKLEGIS
jgi:hypothetical protein